MQKIDFQKISRLNSKIILFGSGNIADKTIRKICPEKIECIVDNSNSLQGTVYKGFDVKSPSEVCYKDRYVLICSTAIDEIKKQLNSFGLNEDIDFSPSPLLNDLIAISELERVSSRLYFTSGTSSTSDDDFGGGLYECKIEGDVHKLTKLYSGPCYGLTRVKDELYFIDTDSGIFKLFNNNISKVCDLPKGGRAHGISYNESNNNFYVTFSYRDSVIEYDKNFNSIREFSLSTKYKKIGEPMHHCNDNYSYGSSLFVSMFSSTGNWKMDRFDGCIAEFDLDTGDRLKDLTSDLYMPHNVMVIDGSLHVLDSLPGHLKYGNLSIAGTFPAFTRGLSFSNGYYYLGQSKNRNYSRVIGLSNNISIDCGIVIFDPILKVSRFISFPKAIGEIHSIVH